MNIIKIDKKGIESDLNRLRSDYQLIGPVKEGAYHVFKALSENEVPDLEFQNTRLSAKELVYPQSEVLFEYSLDESKADHHILREPEKAYPLKAVIGIRPCDVKAFLLVQRNFDTPEYKDPYWIKAFESLTFVGLACHSPCQTCFCTTAGCGPFHEEGLDVLLVDAGDHYLAKALTEKGKTLCAAADWTSQAGTDDAQRDIDRLKQAAEERIVSSVQTDNLKQVGLLALHEAPFWEDVSFSCINCGTCTYLCPTCWCFDIQDENRGKSGVRFRNWDSCMFPLFSLHGSGHNPRGTKVQRVRQRFMHKLKYYVDKYDNGIQCVGCGRCVRHCPVNIDIRSVCNKMNAFGEPAAVCEITT